MKEYRIGDLVYLKTDPEQHPRMITGIMMRPNTNIYYLTYGVNESYHYDIEMTKERDMVKLTT